MRGVAVLTLAVFCAATLDLALLATSASAASGREALEEAQDYFLVADFGTALDRVDSLLESGDLEGGALRDAWVLKARCEIGLAHRSAAVDAYCEALRVDPSWAPDPDLFTKDEVAVFEQAREGCTLETTEKPSPMPPPASAGGQPWYKKKTTWYIAGGVVAAGILAAVLAGGSDEETAPPLAGPPPPPPTP
jgi:hypothetical protein